MKYAPKEHILDTLQGYIWLKTTLFLGFMTKYHIRSHFVQKKLYEGVVSIKCS